MSANNKLGVIPPLLVAIVLLLSRLGASDPLNEDDRLLEYAKRNYSWPIEHFTPDVPGYNKLIQHRLSQVNEIEDPGRRYEGFYQVIHAGFLVQNFTELGFGLVKGPTELTQTLRQAIRDGLPTASYEVADASIDGPLRPRFVHRPDLLQRVKTELHEYVEAWVGMPLVAHQAYGFRLYQNQSQLYMHVDRMETHVISMIYHIDSDETADPWPIYIEDFEGNTHGVILTPGDILFYESSKCFHGRPTKFHGSWYTSVFVHYHPVDYAQQRLESHYAVPKLWSDPPPEIREHRRLEMIETTLKEPDCEHSWCNIQDAIEWSGPGEEGVWIDPRQERHPFSPNRQQSTASSSQGSSSNAAEEL